MKTSSKAIYGVFRLQSDMTQHVFTGYRGPWIEQGLGKCLLILVKIGFLSASQWLEPPDLGQTEEEREWEKTPSKPRKRSLFNIHKIFSWVYYFVQECEVTSQNAAVYCAVNSICTFRAGSHVFKFGLEFYAKHAQIYNILKTPSVSQPLR